MARNTFTKRETIVIVISAMVGSVSSILYSDLMSDLATLIPNDVIRFICSLVLLFIFLVVFVFLLDKLFKALKLYKF